MPLLKRLSLYPHNAAKAAELWREAGGGQRPLRIAAMDEHEGGARKGVVDLEAAQSGGTEGTLYQGEEKLQAQRRLIEKQGPHE